MSNSTLFWAISPHLSSLMWFIKIHSKNKKTSLLFWDIRRKKYVAQRWKGKQLNFLTRHCFHWSTKGRCFHLAGTRKQRMEFNKAVIFLLRCSSEAEFWKTVKSCCVRYCLRVFRRIRTKHIIESQIPPPVCQAFISVTATIDRLSSGPRRAWQRRSIV